MTDEKKDAGVDAKVTTLALLLYKPPFRYDRGYIHDSDNRIVADDDGLDTVGRVRGWGRISYLPNPQALQDKVGEIIALALTEYWNTHT
jgi:hypothetical protein